MRYFVAILSGAFVAVLPLLLVVFPDFAWHASCEKVFLENPPASWITGEFIENRCDVIDETLTPLSTRLLVLVILAGGCVLSGALAARIAEERRMIVAFLAPSLGYLALLLTGGWHLGVLFLGVSAGLLGLLATSSEYLTNAWRATRSKQRTPQA